MTNGSHPSLEKFILAIIDERDKRYEQRFQATEAATQAAFKAADMALSKAEGVMIRDKAQANEWREAMNDRERNFVPRAENAIQHKALMDKIDALTGTRWGGLTAALGWAFAAIALAVSYLRH